MIKQSKHSYANKGQIAALHAMLGKLGRGNDKEFKKDLVLQFSYGRAESSKDLYYNEAKDLLQHLDKMVPKTREEISKEKMIGKIRVLAAKVGWLKNGSVDMERLNNWCIKYGHAHVSLNQYKYNELPMLVGQMEDVYRDHLINV